jgi:colanic acid biosynthesis glycosyl transferase WcaI
MDGFMAWKGGLRDEETFQGIDIARVVVSERGAGGLKNRLKNDIRFFAAVLKKLIAGKFRGTQVVVAYVPTILTTLAAALVKLATGARIVTIVHDIESGLAASLGLTSNPLIIRLMQIVERVALNRSDRIIVLTDGMRSELRRIGCRSPISVISIWASLSPDHPPNAGPPKTLMYSGNFGKKQNLDQLVPLIKRLSDEKNEIRVVMQGDGSEKSRIERLFDEAGIINTVFLSLVPTEEFTRSLQSATVHLVPQALNVANYALPSKLFSIMSAGRPFVCIASPGSPLDILATRSIAGICVPPNDNDRLFHEVVSLVENETELREKANNGRAFVDTYMNKNDIMQQYQSVIVGEHLFNEPAQ